MAHETILLAGREVLTSYRDTSDRRRKGMTVWLLRNTFNDVGGVFDYYVGKQYVGFVDNGGIGDDDCTVHPDRDIREMASTDLDLAALLQNTKDILEGVTIDVAMNLLEAIGAAARGRTTEQ